MDIKNFKGVIFDLDGTLLDSMNVWHQVDVEFFKRRGMEVPKGYKKVISKMPFTAIAEYTKEKYNIKESAKEIIEEWHTLALEEYKFYPYILDVLEEITDTGNYILEHEELFCYHSHLNIRLL